MPEPVTMAVLGAKALGGAKAAAPFLGKAGGAAGLFNLFGGGGGGGSRNAALNELRPMTISSPFGRLENGNYFDQRTAAQQGILNQTEGQLNQSLGYTAPSRSALDAWNMRVMPVANAMYSGAAREINNQYDDGERGLRDQMNARGLVGGSYDALMRARALRDRNRQLASAYDQSQLAGADYNDNWMRMQMQQQQNLAALRSQTQGDLLQSWQLANQTRQINSPLQLARANALMPNSNRSSSIFGGLNAAANFSNAARRWFPGG